MKKKELGWELFRVFKPVASKTLEGISDIRDKN
jgi:hypothetical protein